MIFDGCSSSLPQMALQKSQTLKNLMDNSLEDSIDADQYQQTTRVIPNSLDDRSDSLSMRIETERMQANTLKKDQDIHPTEMKLKLERPKAGKAPQLEIISSVRSSDEIVVSQTSSSPKSSPSTSDFFAMKVIKKRKLFERN
jgi:hypothetical protein